MHDNDSFRLICKEDALFVLLLVAIGAASAFIGDDEKRAQKMERADEQSQSQQCDFTIAQYGPGERWHPNAPQPVCAKAAAELPSHILTSPIPQ